MTIERQELLDCTAKLHARIEALEAELKAADENRALYEADFRNATERERLAVEDAACLRTERQALEAENKALRERAEKAEAACAEMREAFWTDHHHAPHSAQRCFDRIQAVVTACNCGQPLLNRMRAMEELLNSCCHSQACWEKRDDGKFCIRCRWEKLKQQKAV